MAEINEAKSRVAFYGEILNTVLPNCYLWCYAADGTLLETNCQFLALDKVFQHSGSYEYMLSHFKEHTEPLVMSGNIGIMWGAVMEAEADALRQIHVLGPVLTQTMDIRQFDELTISSSISAKWKPKLLKILNHLPVMNITSFFNRLVALEYCVSGRNISHSDIHLQQTPVAEQKKAVPEEEWRADRNQVYRAEQTLLQMVRDGNLNRHELNRIGSVFTGNQKLSPNALQHAKLSQVQFIALCSRAAIEGGLSPEVAYSRNDAYIQAVESARTISDITQIGRTMYSDFLELVHKQKADPAISKPIRTCCDYIQLHLGEKISVSTLARQVGYSDYYLSRVFKQQTCQSIDQYIRNLRIERAKFLLINTQESIQDISDQLGFSNRNYFTQVFTQITGQSPAAFRNENRRV